MTEETLFQSPLRREHRLVARFQKNAIGLCTPDNLLYGERESKWPMLALSCQPDMGSCRHALSQMVVAGTMSVYPPIHISPNPEAFEHPSNEPTPREGE